MGDHYLISSFRSGWRAYFSDNITKVSFAIFLFIAFLAIFGPYLTPHPYDEIIITDGELLRLEPPSSNYLLGTTNQGKPVFSRLIYGARPTLAIGLAGGAIIIGVGLTTGVLSGYYGGSVDSVLMRITDFFYSVPIIPTAIVIVTFFGIGFWSSVFFIGAILWRGNARVFRSQVMQLKTRSYVTSARAEGASNLYIVVRHILPNMGGMIVMFFALGMGLSILISASLAFLGVMSPFIPSWGIMLRNAYNSGLMTQAWWWALPPGFMISLTVLSTFLLGRGYERVQQQLSEGMIQ